MTTHYLCIRQTAVLLTIGVSLSFDQHAAAQPNLNTDNAIRAELQATIGPSRLGRAS